MKRNNQLLHFLVNGQVYGRYCRASHDYLENHSLLFFDREKYVLDSVKEQYFTFLHIKCVCFVFLSIVSISKIY